MADDDAPDEGGTEQDTQEVDDGQQEPEQPRRQTSRSKAARTSADDDTDGDPDRGKTFSQDDVDRLIADRLKREQKKYSDYADLKKKAQAYDQAEDAKKTELEKLNDQLTSAQVELQGFKVSEIRRNAAEQAGLPAKYAKYITAADEAEALEQAQELADELKPAEPKQADFRQGSRQPARQPESRNDLLRRMAGH